jgi:hypothetical protein
LVVVKRKSGDYTLNISKGPVVPVPFFVAM